MEAQFHLGRQPIVDRKGELIAYELLFRHSHKVNSAEVSDDFLATAHVIQNTFSQFGLEQVLGKQLGFINVSADLLLSDVLELLPHQQMVLEILETVEITTEIIDRCIALREIGFQLALDDITELTPAHLALLPHIQFVKLDLLAATRDEITQAVKILKHYPVKLLAEKIDTHEQHEHCQKLGFDLFQGYFFAKPTILSGKKPNASQAALIRLLGLVHGDDDNSEIESAFKQSPELTVNLLKIVNSVGAGTHQKIDSVARALVVLGRRQLCRWVQLLAFTQHGSKQAGSDPLAQTAAIRGKLMELIARHRYPKDKALPDKAFMTGMLSLLEPLFQQAMADIVVQLNLSDEVSTALLHHNGILGEMLKHVEDAERECPESSEQYPECAPLMLEAMAWSNSLEINAKN